MGDEKLFVPEWLTVRYIEKALQKGLNHPNLKIEKCEMSPATAVGDHYASVMIRVSLVIQTNGKDEDFAFIIKIPPPGKFIESTKNMNIFGREIKMFTKTLPALNKILRKVFPHQESLCAECYYDEDNDNITCIFLEDLRRSGFTLGDRFGCLEWDHTSLVLKSLAKLHASSLIYIDEDPDPISLYDNYVWSSTTNRDLIAGIYEKPIKSIAKAMEKWENVPKKEIYIEKIKALEDAIIDKVIEIYARDDTKLNVICHADVWINNMMFRYDKNNKVNGLRFLDFQISHYNNPALDLNYFIFLSTKTRFTDTDSLLEVYHETFMETLNGLNYELKKPFTLNDLKKEFRDKLFFGFATVLSILPITTVPASKAPKVDDMMDKSEATDSMFDREEFMDILKVALPYFEKAGVF